MSVKDMVEQAEMEHFGKVLTRLIEARYKSVGDFGRAFYKANGTGKPSGLSNCYKWARGSARPVPATRKQLAEHFGVPVSEFALPVKDGVTSVFIPNERRPPFPDPPPRKPVPQFSLVVNDDGTSTLTLNMTMPTEAAMRAMHTLMASGVLPGGGNTQ